LIETKDSTWGLDNCPKPYIKYRQTETAQSKLTTSTKALASMTKHKATLINQGTEKLDKYQTLGQFP